MRAALTAIAAATLVAAAGAPAHAAHRGHRCPYPLSVHGRAYQVTVHGRLGCTKGGNALGAFLAAHIDPDGFDCAMTDPRTGGDAACVRTSDRSARVVARRVHEV